MALHTLIMRLLLLASLPVLAAADIVASNVSAGATSPPGAYAELVLTGTQRVSDLVPLTRKAATNMSVRFRHIREHLLGVLICFVLGHGSPVVDNFGNS
jgi:hypothetical protein